MVESRINTAIIETSDIVYDGLSNILLKGKYYNVFRIDDLVEVDRLVQRHDLTMVIINPTQVQNRLKLFKSLRESFPELVWIGLIYSFYEPGLLSRFDGLININHTASEIFETLKKIRGDESIDKPHGGQEKLTERETDVLIHLVKGLSNKEIADKLNISIHTVISHRKSITQKVGIKSQPGLTIYAISNKIVTMESLI